MYLRDVHAETAAQVLRELVRNNPLGILTTAIPSTCSAIQYWDKNTWKEDEMAELLVKSWWGSSGLGILNPNAKDSNAEVQAATSNKRHFIGNNDQLHTDLKSYTIGSIVDTLRIRPHVEPAQATLSGTAGGTKVSEADGEVAESAPEQG